jgi:2-(3-amino-3-carboxypropyl)histidine synthase
VDAFLYIGTGDFHPIEVGLRTGKDVYIYSPVSKELKLLDKKILEGINKRRKGSYLAFLTRKNIGFLVTTKSGQNNIKTAWALKEYIKKKFPEKNVYIFGGDTIDFSQLENFPYIDVWVNTMCPRISTDDAKKFAKPIIDARELKEEFGMRVPNLISTFN